MPLPSFRSSRSKVRRRRAHHALKPTGHVGCPNCGAPLLPHRACKACGFYKGRNVRGASVAKAEKVLAKATKKSAPKSAAPRSAETAEVKKPAVKRAVSAKGGSVSDGKKVAKKAEAAE